MLFNKLRIGLGFDSHAFCNNKKLILGGIEISSEKGLEGHSDGDVLIHSIIDALIGAAGMADIGELFPDDKAEYKNISSVLLLEKVYFMLKQNMWEIINIDCVLICDYPKINVYKTKIINKLSETLNISSEQINIKGKTTEGFIQEAKGIIVHTSCLLHNNA